MKAVLSLTFFDNCDFKINQMVVERYVNFVALVTYEKDWFHMRIVCKLTVLTKNKTLFFTDISNNG